MLHDISTLQFDTYLIFILNMNRTDIIIQYMKEKNVLDMNYYYHELLLCLNCWIQNVTRIKLIFRRTWKYNKFARKVGNSL